MYPAHYVNYLTEVNEMKKKLELRRLFGKLMQLLDKLHQKYSPEAIIDGVINGIRVYSVTTPKDFQEVIETIEAFGFRIVEIKAKDNNFFFTLDFREIIRLLNEQSLVRNIGNIEVHSKSGIYITVFRVDAEKNLNRAYKRVECLIDALSVKGEVRLDSYNAAFRQATFFIRLG